MAVPSRRTNETTHKAVDVLRMLGDHVEVKAAPAVFCQHLDGFGHGGTCGPVGQIVVRLVDQEDGSIWLCLPVLEVDLFPAVQLATGHGFEAPVMAHGAVFFELAFTHPLKGVQGLACAIGAADEVQHGLLLTEALDRTIHAVQAQPNGDGRCDDANCHADLHERQEPYEVSR